MQFVQKKGWLAAAVVIGQMALNACQTQSDIVTPTQTVAINTVTSASDWTAVKAENWTKNATNPGLRVAGFVDNAITSSIVADGMVVAFYRDAVTREIKTLPAIVGGQLVSFSYHALNDKGIISIEQEGGQPVAGEYRWVVVPKEALATANWNEYATAKQWLGLTD